MRSSLLGEVRALPGVRAAALGSDSPLGEDVSATLVRIAGRDDVTQDDGIRVYRHSASLLGEVTPTDAATYALTSAALLLVTLLASWAPARRATRVDPIEVLRSE